jgi:signal transduction histidine kinase
MQMSLFEDAEEGLMTRIGIILGSTRPDRNGEQVARRVLDIASRRDDAEFELIDLRDCSLPHIDEPMPPFMGAYADDHTKEWAEEIASFDGFVMVMPAYNHSTSGVLKNDTESMIATFTALVATAISNFEAREAVAASRARVVAATDDERRRVVRALHEGAQHRLVNTIMTLKLARRAFQSGEADALALLTEALDHAQQAMAELHELAHGILPAALSHGGLRPAVEVLASRMPMPVETSVAVGRLPAAVEATAYFVVAEALSNVAKHARAGHAVVAASVEDATLRVQVRDDGVGGTRADGSGLVGLADRLAAVDGRLRVESPADGGTLLAADIPLRRW